MSVANKLSALVRKMKEMASVSRREQVARDEPVPIGSSAVEPPEMVRELLDVEAFREAVALDLPLVNVDSTRTVFHPHPRACTGVEDKWFIQKVIENERVSGGYFAVRDGSAARARWPNMTSCQRCS